MTSIVIQKPGCEPKEWILQKILKYVDHYTPLTSANMATLGGNGLEAKMWQQAGIPGPHGWLIEKSRQKSRNLIRTFNYRYLNRLENFPQVFKSIEGAHAGIDFLHLDFCGTLEPHWEILRPVFELVANSQGKIIAITVADARRNLALDNFGPVLKSLSEQLNTKAAEALFSRLEHEQTYINPENSLPDFFQARSPLKGAKKELSVLNLVLHALRELRISLEEVQRFVYLSKALGKRSFRMRTYVLRICSHKAAITHKTIDDVWFRNGLEVVNFNSRMIVNITPTKEKDNMATKPFTLDANRFPALASMLPFFGDQAVKELQDLISAREQDATAGIKTEEIKALVDRLHGMVHSQNGTTQKAPTTAPPLTKESTAPQPTPETAVKVTIPSDISQRSVQIAYAVLRARATLKNSKLDAAKAAIGEHFGLKGKNGKLARGKSLTFKIAGYATRTTGRQRPDFIKDIIATLPDKTSQVVRLEELAKYYNNLGIPTTVEELLKEAKS